MKTKLIKLDREVLAGQLQDELKAAFPELQFWVYDGYRDDPTPHVDIFGGPTDEQVEQVLALVAAHEPEDIDPNEFGRRKESERVQELPIIKKILKDIEDLKRR